MSNFSEPPPPYAEPSFTCAICLTETENLTTLKCCYKQGSSMVYCETCLKTLALQNSNNQPNSNSFFGLFSLNQSSSNAFFNCPSCSLVLDIRTLEPAIGRCYRCSPTSGHASRRHKLGKTDGGFYADGVLRGLCTECDSADRRVMLDVMITLFGG